MKMPVTSTNVMTDKLKIPYFCAPDGQLSANRLQKKFDDPKMAGAFFIVAGFGSLVET